jgi:hypothetical protein
LPFYQKELIRRYRVKGMVMKILGYIVAVIGFIVMIGAAGNSDFYYECLAAADCVVKGPPPTLLDTFLQAFAGLVIMLGGSFWAYLWSE